MWVVRDIVDTESGEIVVKAGAQIGDKVSLIQQSEIKKIEIVEGVVRCAGFQYACGR